MFHVKHKKGITIMQSDDILYSDTDSVTTLKAKLNSIYGSAIMAAKDTKDYIVTHKAKRPVIIFKKFIMAVELNTDDNRAIIYCSDGSGVYVDEKYSDVIKQLI